MAEPLLILCHGRSGSHFLGRSLAATPGIRWDGECLGWWRLGSDPEQSVRDWIDSVRAWPHDRIVAAKAMFWPEEAASWIEELPCRIMALRRRDQTAAAISAARAHKSRDWFFGWKPQAAPSDEEIAHHLERMRATLLEPAELTLWSEDLWRNSDRELTRLSDWLGIGPIACVRAWKSSKRQGVA